MLGIRLRRVPSNPALGRLNLPYRLSRTRLPLRPAFCVILEPAPAFRRIPKCDVFSFCSISSRRSRLRSFAWLRMASSREAAMGLSPKPMAAGGRVLARREFHRRWQTLLSDNDREWKEQKKKAPRQASRGFWGFLLRLRDQYIPPIPPIPPPGGIGGAPSDLFSSGISATNPSVVNNSPAILEAF